MDTHCCPWIHGYQHGYPWTSMDTTGHPWTPTHIHGHPWIATGIQCITGLPLGSPEIRPRRFFPPNKLWFKSLRTSICGFTPTLVQLFTSISVFTQTLVRELTSISVFTQTLVHDNMKMLLMEFLKIKQSSDWKRSRSKNIVAGNIKTAKGCRAMLSGKVVGKNAVF